MATDDPEGYRPETDYLEIANEYAYVQVRKVSTRNGVRLEIHSPKLGFRTFLSPLELESLTWTPKSIFDKFLKTPYGT